MTATTNDLQQKNPSIDQSQDQSRQEALQEAHRVFDVEIKALVSIKERLGDDFIHACKLLQQCRGKIVVTGIGKSGQIGRKIASTFSSTGTPAIFLHPAESSHGDLGLVATEDVILAITYGGASPEMNDIFRYAQRKGIRVVLITGRKDSVFAAMSDVVLDIQVPEEACPMGLAPTSSTTATLVMGDALAMQLLKWRGFGPEDFAEFHPGGSLGRRLLTRVQDVMHGSESLPLVPGSAPIREVVTLMTRKEVRGVAGVVDSAGHLIGVITDGDIRRCLEKSANPLSEKAEGLMSRAPKTIDAHELAEKALFLMEQFLIQTLFVTDKSSSDPLKPIGLLHLQDLIKAKIR